MYTCQQALASLRLRTLRGWAFRAVYGYRHLVQHRRAMKASLKADPKRGERLKGLRERAGLTQQKLAEKLGVEKSTVSRWEGGHVFPRDNIRKLCDIFDVEPAYISFGVEASDGVETYPAFDDFTMWLADSPYAKITAKWMVEALRTLRVRLPADVEPTLEVYKHLHQAMLAMSRRT